MREIDKDQGNFERVGVATTNPAGPDIESVLAEYQVLREVSLEEVYRTQVAPLIDNLLEGARERKILDRVIGHWKETRLRGWENPLDEAAREISFEMDTEYHFYTRSRAGDEIIPWIENTWLLFHLLRSVYGVRAKNFEEVNEEKGDRWIEILGDGFQQEGALAERSLTKLEQEAKLIREYCEQYTDFEQEHQRELHTISQRSSTPGSTRREAFNAVLAVGYGFRPRWRATISNLEDKFCRPGSAVKSKRLTLEKLWIENYTRITEPETIKVFTGADALAVTDIYLRSQA